MTECNQSTFEFAAHFSRQVVARFDGGTITTDSGGLLLRETDWRLNLLPRFAECFLDARNPVFVEHSVQELVSQRVYGLALGYEDLNDHEQLRQDPLLRVLAGKRNVEESPLAGKSTLNRMELSDGTPHRYKKITYWKAGIDELLVKVSGIVCHAPGRNRLGCGRHRLSVAWRTGRAVLPRLLRQLLLFAAVHILRRPDSVCAPAAVQQRRVGRQSGGDSTHRGADPGGLAGGEDHFAWRLGLLPQ
jgi:hypothetical protein